MFDLELPLWGLVLVFLASTVAIGITGVQLAKFADRLADRTGIGEALTGSIFLGLITALPGLAASVTAAARGHPVLAISNAMGGIAFQTVVLAVADIAYRRANLEHAAASAANMMQAIMLILLLTTVLIGISGPDIVIGHVHPITIALIFIAGLAFWTTNRVREQPMWRPAQTAQTVEDEPAAEAHEYNLVKLIAGLTITGLITCLAGGLVAEAGVDLARQTGISESIVGGLFTAAATSLPELVTCIAAVRRGALTLAVGDIVGGNFFDVLFVAAADFVFVAGSIYHGDGVGNREVFITSLTVMLNVLLLSGLIYRQTHGPANIGFESVLMSATYLAGFIALSWLMS